MRNLFNPKWLLLINTLPIILVTFLYTSQYNIIKTLLPEESIKLWWMFGGALALMGLFNFMYTVLLIANKKLVPLGYSFVALSVCLPFLYLYGYNSSDILPWDIPNWMVPDSMIVYLGTFLMPTIAYSMALLVIGLTDKYNEKHTAFKNFSFAIAVPLSWYLFSHIVFTVLRPDIPEIGGHIIAVFVIISTVIFLFFLSRGIYLLATKRGGKGWNKYYPFVKVVFAVLLPLLGLAVNNGPLWEFPGGIFGEFSSPWFYGLAIVNGLLICAPNHKSPTYRLTLFIGRSITFSYTFYFFLVFLPYLPLSVVAIAAIGLGFLMLTPLILFIIHGNQLSEDIQFLSATISKKFLGFLALVGFLVIPIVITVTNLKDKYVLNETLDFIYSPDYSKEYNLNKKSITRILETVNGHKENSRNSIMGTKIPYLSTYYNWLVLDNLTLSKNKIATIEKIFFGKNTGNHVRSENLRNKDVNLTNISSSSQFDPEQNAWLSWVDLEITNASGRSIQEYATDINLPVGCWISDYYLYVGDKKEPGILTEKKTALWIFSQIRNQNRDPGLLYYRTGNKVAFRVFPFARDEVRKTGIQFLHKEPISLEFDGRTVQLGTAKEQPVINKTSALNDGVIYLSPAEKKKLPVVERTPYYHFIVDVSKSDHWSSEQVINSVEAFTKNHAFANGASSKISFVNTYTKTQKMGANWQEELLKQPFEGGFYLERAIKTILYEQYKKNSPQYPVLVVVSRDINQAIVEKDFADFALAFPESNQYYVLNETGASILPHSLIQNPKIQLNSTSDLQLSNTVLAWPNAKQPLAYLPNNEEGAIILKSTDLQLDSDQLKEKNWNSALAMRGQFLAQTFQPQRSDQSWVDQVRASFKTRVMHPTTSYIVVENEAQKAMIQKKQKQALAGNKSLDMGDDPQRMSEPGLWLLVVLSGLYLFSRRRKELGNEE